MWPVTIAGAIVAILYREGPPKTADQLMILVVLVSLGLLAWAVQFSGYRAAEEKVEIITRQHEIIKTQERISAVLENHLSQIEKSLAVILTKEQEASDRALQFLPAFIQMSESIRSINEKVLDAILKK